MEKRKMIQVDEPAHRALKARAALEGRPLWKTASRIIAEALVVQRRSYAKTNN
jgi:hypothetical protein